MHAPHLTRGGRYPVLRALAILYLIGAAVAVIAAVVTAGWVLLFGPAGMGDRVILASVALAAGFFAVIMLLAAAELFKLLMDLEHNTRMAALGMAGRATGQAGESPEAGRLADGAEETAEEALVRGH
jgi:hypothetical protein